MKSIQSILLVIIAAAVAVLYVLHFRTANPKEPVTRAVKKDSGTISDQHLRVAYIDLDTIQKYYEFFKLKNDDIEREKTRYDNQIQSELNKLERDRVEFLKKGQAITQVEAEKFQQEYQTRYQQIGQKQETLQNQHLQNRSNAIEEIGKRIDEYLKEFNKDKKYNFIFSTQDGNPTLYYKDTTFNVTSDVLKGLNEEYRKKSKKVNK